MRYMLMIYGNEAGMAAASKEAVTQMSAAYASYTEAMATAGILQGGERLRPTSEATTVRVKNGKTEVLDGPYADTKEQLAGATAPGRVDQLPAGDGEQPGLRVGGTARERPIRQRRGKGVGQRILGGSHVPGASREKGNQLAVAAARDRIGGAAGPLMLHIF